MWYVISGAALWADRVLKRKARRGQLPESILHDHIRFQHIENDGLAGSKLRNNPKAVKCIHIVAYAFSIPALVVFCWDGLAAKCGISLIAAGGGSNLFDRLRRGTVTDVIQFSKAPGRIKHLVFNLADFMILLGSICTAIGLFHQKHP